MPLPSHLLIYNTIPFSCIYPCPSALARSDILSRNNTLIEKSRRPFRVSTETSQYCPRKRPILIDPIMSKKCSLTVFTILVCTVQKKVAKCFLLTLSSRQLYAITAISDNTNSSATAAARNACVSSNTSSTSPPPPRPVLLLFLGMLCHLAPILLRLQPHPFGAGVEDKLLRDGRLLSQGDSLLDRLPTVDTVATVASGPWVHRARVLLGYSRRLQQGGIIRSPSPGTCRSPRRSSVRTLMRQLRLSRTR